MHIHVYKNILLVLILVIRTAQMTDACVNITYNIYVYKTLVICMKSCTILFYSCLPDQFCCVDFTIK